MATPTEFPEQTRNLGRPAGWDEEECGGLPVCDAINGPTGRPEYVSCWRLSWRERLAVLFRGRVWLGVIAVFGHPPVWLGTDPGFRPADPAEAKAEGPPRPRRAPGPPDPPATARHKPVG